MEIDAPDDSARRLYQRTGDPGWLTIARARERQREEAMAMQNAIRQAEREYLTLLRHPHDAERFTPSFQRQLCEACDRLARLLGWGEERTQNHYEWRVLTEEIRDAVIPDTVAPLIEPARPDAYLRIGDTLRRDRAAAFEAERLARQSAEQAEQDAVARAVRVMRRGMGG